MMLDLKFLLQNLETVQAELQTRGTVPPELAQVRALTQSRNQAQQRYDQLRNEQNQASLEIQKLKKSGGDASSVLAAMKQVAEETKKLSPEIEAMDGELQRLLLRIPNLPHASVPRGKSEDDNVVVRTWGEKPDFDFTPKSHWEIGEALNLLDFERGAKIAGARFTLYRGLGARLERALMNFMLETQTQENGYEEVLPPYLVNEQSLLGTGQLPKFAEDLFRTEQGYYLIPTAEVPVTNIFRDEILREDQLPISFTAHTPCFRSEAGSYGKDVRGLVRQHQFHKVELVKFVKPEQSYEALEQLTGHAESILQKLGLHYRVVALCTGDLGFSAAKTYDLEVWLPGQNCYREISSCSNFEAFQARRAKIRFKDSHGKNEFVHTLNGSGLAVGRTFLAVLENYQQRDGSVEVPEVLRKWMNVDCLK